jgi:hypothetical protein
MLKMGSLGGATAEPRGGFSSIAGSKEVTCALFVVCSEATAPVLGFRHVAALQCVLMPPRTIVSLGFRLQYRGSAATAA